MGDAPHAPLPDLPSMVPAAPASGRSPARVQ